MKICNNCNKQFRDNYALERHNNKKKVCVKTNNRYSQIEINNFGEEDFKHIDIQSIINEVYELNQIDYDPYIRAGNIIAIFHKFVIENEKNKNVEVKNIKSIIAKIYKKNTWVNDSTTQLVYRILKIRAKQLIEFKETIEEYDENFFKIDLNKDMWRHLEAFAKFGGENNGINDTTRRVHAIIRVVLIN